VNPLNQQQESEARLITRAQQGDREAFGELVMNHHTAVYTTVYRMTGDASLAEDATQQAFLKAWLHLASYQPRASLRAWLSRIAINSGLDVLRREKHTTPDDELIEESVDAHPGPESALIEKEQAQSIQKALLALSETNRSVLVLREYSDLSYREIATALNIPLGTVMSRLNAARMQLRMILQPQLEEIEVQYG
jgi:RNA polymerase sigma-70 factor (ECF subfamily)